MNEYIDTIDSIVDNLKSELDRRVKAYNSGYFCDNKTIMRHMKVLKYGIDMIESKNLEEFIKDNYDKMDITYKLINGKVMKR